MSDEEPDYSVGVDFYTPDGDLNQGHTMNWYMADDDEDAEVELLERAVASLMQELIVRSDYGFDGAFEQVQQLVMQIAKGGVE